MATKLTWRFSPNQFTGKSSAPGVDVKHFKTVTIDPPLGTSTVIQFRRVSTTGISKAK
jgi:hypothetical protein